MWWAGLLATAVCGAFVFAGCTAAPAAPAGAATLDAAEAVAMEWDPDAALLAVAAVEARDPARLLEGDEDKDRAAALSTPDGSPGDGVAPAWLYMYQRRGDGPGLQVIVSPQGEVLWQDTQAPRMHAHPLDRAQWHIDAPRAWELAEAAAPFTGAPKEAPWAVVEQLGMLKGFDHPVWLLVSLQAPEGEARPEVGAMSLVDAYNGTVFDVGDYIGTFLEPPEQGEVEELVEAVRPVASHTFVVEDLHELLVVALGFDPSTPPGQGVVVDVTGPDGVAATFRADSAVLDMDAAHVRLELPTRGTYTVQVRLDAPGPSGIAAAYDLSWCTEGFEFGFAFLPFFGERVEACDYN